MTTKELKEKLNKEKLTKEQFLSKWNQATEIIPKSNLRRLNDAIIVNTESLAYELSSRNRIIFNNYVDAINSFDTGSGEMVKAIFDNRHGGGTIVISWNQMIGLLWAMLNDMRVARRRKWFQFWKTE